MKMFQYHVVWKDRRVGHDQVVSVDNRLVGAHLVCGTDQKGTFIQLGIHKYDTMYIKLCRMY